MKILITGALGHIGSRFIHSLRPDDYQQVVLLDNLSTQRYCSLFNLPEGVPFQFIEGDICSADLVKLFDGVDLVLHLAAIASAAESLEAQTKVEQVNYQGTQLVAQACAACGCKLIFPSTTSVYGCKAGIAEEDCPPEALAPQSPYAASKLHAEQYLQTAGIDMGLDFTICRFGTIFGPSIGMRFHTAINRFVWQACAGLPLTVWRTALNQARPYLDLGDAVRAISFIMDRKLFNRHIYNIATLNTTVSEIVTVIKQFIPGVCVHLIDSPLMNTLSYDMSCQRFQSLGFECQGSIERGIQDTIRLLRNSQHARL